MNQPSSKADTTTGAVEMALVWRLTRRGNPARVILRITTSFLLVCFLITLLQAQGWNPDDGLILRGDLVTMNETLDVIPDGRVVVLGEKIVAVLQHGESPPGDLEISKALTVNTNGWIFPGLIDAHNHTAYNVLSLWKAPKKYDNRYQWSSPKSYKQHVSYPKNLLTSPKYYDLQAEVVKYAEVKAIVGGVTAIQGSPNLNATRLLVRNIEHKNFAQDRIYQRVFTIKDSKWQDTLKDGLLKKMADGNVDAWLVHLAEGTDDSSRKEFKILKNIGLLGNFTMAIHGTALERKHFHELAQAGTKLVWSPLSNLLLYGQTTKIPDALEKGVVVCLGSDWSPSGSKNLLGELKVADQIDKNRFDDVISDQELVRMVTANPALALGLDDKIGQLKEGLYADIAVFSKVDPDPYRSLIDSNERHVSLVLVGGEPLYGDRQIMESLKPGDFEILPPDCLEKAIDVTDRDVYKGKQKIAEILQLLEQAIAFDKEHMRQTFGDKMNAKEFDDFLNDRFKHGILPKQLDPIFPFGDTYFFNTVKNSTVANLSFDLSSYWEVSGTPPAEKVPEVPCWNSN